MCNCRCKGACGCAGTINDEYLGLITPTATTIAELRPIQQKIIAMQNPSTVPGAATEPVQSATVVPVSGTGTVPVTPATSPAAATTSAATVQPPVANAGSEQDVTLPNNGIILDGNMSTDPQGQTLTYSWALAAGPNVPTEQQISNSAIGVTNLIAGTYEFELTVTNTSGLSSSAMVVVNVTDDSGTAGGSASASGLGGGAGGASDGSSATGAAATTSTSDFSLVWIGIALIVAVYVIIKD